ncbi:hypothetical protein TRAPUB_7278 [Trametes pubescens]|uniref:Uncharacterized protein n=1 Tax=Trametes pubescens TaxID=154538 RepID=A0A1M2V3K8_TRAPU|nr:hypothetical protein TRAPUB_7278 [Trametes pubescens]
MPYDEANSRLMLIDDRDPAVQYENSWARDLRFGSTVSVSSTPNASVSMEFDGTRIIVVALAAPSAVPPTVQFAIDGALADPDPDTPGAAVYADWTFYALFDSQGLAEGRHTINATLLHAADEYPLMLDTFMFQPSKKYWGLALAPETLQVDEDAGTDVGKGGKVDVGAVVGGVLGGLVLLALGVVLFWWCRRRRQHAYTSLGGEGHFSGESHLCGYDTRD